MALRRFWVMLAHVHGQTLNAAERCGRGLGDVGDQLRRASLSIQLNIAEGSGQFSGNSARYYGIARGSALECAAILDAAEDLDALGAPELEQAREFLYRIVSMLTAMVNPVRER